MDKIFKCCSPFCTAISPTNRQELYEVAVWEGSSSRRVLTKDEKVRRCKAFEQLVGDIAAICGIRDIASKSRLLWWKLRMRVRLVWSMRKPDVRH